MNLHLLRMFPHIPHSPVPKTKLTARLPEQFEADDYECWTRTIHISGNLLGLLVYSYDDSCSELWVWDWTLGRLLLVSPLHSYWS